MNEIAKVRPISINDIREKIKKHRFKDIADVRPIIRMFYDAIISNHLRSIVKYLPFFSDEFLIAFYVYILKKNSHSIF